MSWGPLSGIQIAKNLSTNASLTTSPPWFIGDWRQITVSVSTQSNTGVVIQTSNADGLQSEIPENSWFNHITVTGLGSITSIFALTPGARWSRSSSQANSNCTIIFAGRS